MDRRNNCRVKASGFATGGGEELEQVAWSPDIKNRINLIGRAGDKPDIRYLDSGKVVARIGLAVDRPNRNDPDWFDIEVWDTLAEVVANQANPDWVPASLDKLDETRGDGRTGSGMGAKYQNPTGSAASDYDVPF
eukprot:jgi/Pico_ML_1/51818/g2664.t1